MTQKTIKRKFGVLALLFAISTGYLLFWPVPFAPAAWNPSASPHNTPPYTVNNLLKNIERLDISNGKGPETVIEGPDGALYTGLTNGSIIRMTPDGEESLYSTVYTRPLGLAFDQQGVLYVANSEYGLVAVATDGSFKVVAEGLDEGRFVFINDVDVAPDGMVYFTETSTKFPIEESRPAFFEHRPNGRLLSYNPNTGEVITVLDQLYYANGLAIEKNGMFALVSETTRYQVRRVYLDSARLGHNDIFISNLPGTPTGITINNDGFVWLPLSGPRISALDKILPYTLARKIIWRMSWLIPFGPQSYSYVMGLSPNADVIVNLQNPDPDAYGPITSVLESNNYLYLSGGFEELWEASIARMPLKDIYK
jgi:sugar lactone lactonase YvrE